MEGNLILLFCVMLPFAGALVSYVIGRKNKIWRDYFADGVVVLEFILFLLLFISYGKMGEQQFIWRDFCGMGLQLTLDGFRVLYGLIAAFMWMMTTVFSKEYLKSYRNRNRYYMFVLLTLGATVGVFLSADLYTTFIFFEIMSFTSYVWVAHDETKEAMRAAGTYLAIAVIGGLVMLMGIFLLYDTLGTLRIDQLRLAAIACSAPGKLFPAGLCLLFGFGAKAGVFPLHIWLPKAHPVAPAPASALLSGILTKAGVFGILILSCQLFWHNGVWGTLILTLGVITMLLGALLALFSVNIKRTLACSSLSQIGFIMVGIGMIGLLGDENILAIRGSLLHMVNHSLIKLVLFMAAGVIYMNLHRLDLNEIRGFGRNKPLFHLIFLAGAFGIGGVPAFNGYISKTLLHESIVEYRELLAEGALQPLFFGAGNMAVIEWIFLISGGLTVAYMTKLYGCVFVEKNADAAKQERYDAMRKTYMNPVSAAALTVSALVILLLGALPSLTMDKLADLGQGFLEFERESEQVAYFSAGNLKGAMISLLIGAAVYVLIVRTYMMRAETETDAAIIELSGKRRREYCNRLSEKLDLENLLYRPLLLKILPFLGAVVCRIGDSLVDSIVVLLRKTIYKDSPLPHELTEGTPVTHMAGSSLDHISYWIRSFLAALPKTAAQKEKAKRRRMENGMPERPVYRKWFEHKFAALHAAVSQYNSVITRSMSFGLFLFCVGFLATIVYLLMYYH
ncbi:MAG: NADH dehydrogenase [Lachnospiraceae bacterium]|nr:NADH dehydrogenase [Lachnospiraceae bacterium]